MLGKFGGGRARDRLYEKSCPFFQILHGHKWIRVSRDGRRMGASDSDDRPKQERPARRRLSCGARLFVPRVAFHIDDSATMGAFLPQYVVQCMYTHKHKHARTHTLYTFLVYDFDLVLVGCHWVGL